MLWTYDQRARLALEERLLRENGMEHFAFLDPAVPGSTRIEGLHQTTAENLYRLTLRLSRSQPDVLPDLYVSYPTPLLGYGGKLMTDHGTSHDMHTWSSDWGGYTKICHWKQEYWSASNTLVAVLMKGMLWLESFELHRRTGRPIHEYSLNF